VKNGVKIYKPGLIMAHTQYLKNPTILLQFFVKISMCPVQCGISPRKVEELPKKWVPPQKYICFAKFLIWYFMHKIRK
jgi:hypothetical protein